MDTTKKAGDGLLLTPKCRLSYPNLFQPLRPDLNGNLKFSCALIFDEAAIKDPLFAAMRQGAAASLAATFGAKLPPNLKKGLRDGSEKEGPGYGAGTWFMNVSAQIDYPPKLVGPDGRPLLVKSAWYPGCYVRAKLSPYVYNKPTAKGVAFGLRGLQWLADGEPLGSVGGDAEFDAVPGAAPPRVASADSFAADSGAPESASVADEDIPF